MTAKQIKIFSKFDHTILTDEVNVFLKENELDVEDVMMSSSMTSIPDGKGGHHTLHRYTVTILY